MDLLADLFLVTHALAGAVFLGALVARWVVLALAERADSLAAVRTLTRAAVPFERSVVIGSTAVLALGVATAAAQGRPFLGPLQGAPIDWLFASVLLYLSIVPLIPFVFLPKARVFDAALEEATRRDELTPALDAAFRDPVVRAAHVYELSAVTLIFALMVSKPF